MIWKKWNEDNSIPGCRTTVWTVDRIVGDFKEVAIEWSMSGYRPSSSKGVVQPFIVRGAEHYNFKGSAHAPLISETRQYWNNQIASDSQKGVKIASFGLHGFRYDSTWAQATLLMKPPQSKL